MIFPAINLHLFWGFSMAMLNNQVVLYLDRQETDNYQWTTPNHCLDTGSTTQGGGGSFRDGKPIWELGCCDSWMAEWTHWWIERRLERPAIYLSVYPSLDLSIDLSIHPSIHLSIVHQGVKRLLLPPVAHHLHDLPSGNLTVCYPSSSMSYHD